MLKPSSLLIAGLCAAGLISGYGANRLLSGRHGSATRQETSSTSPPESATGSAEISPDGKPKPKAPEIPHVRSTETVESLLAPDDGSLYARLAKWMADASEQDIAAYWAGYQGGKRSNDITDLVFLNWTRLDPQAAIAATAGGKDEHYAWWAWAAHDPKRALAAAIAANPDRVNNVAWGIGEFHPEWMRQHFQEIPEAARRNAMQGYTKWDDTQDPLEALKFMKENQMGFDSRTFKILAEQDPWAALDWIKENPGRSNDPFADEGSDDGRMHILFTSMASERLEDLKRLAAQTPSGELKRKMEAAIFENLLTTDPAAALEQAKATAAPVIAAERYAKIGMNSLRTDPEKAFEMAEALLSTTSGKLDFEIRVESPNGYSSSGASGESPANELMQSLLAKDPARIVEMAALHRGSTSDSSQSFSLLCNQWASQDLVSYTNWVNLQKDPATRDTGASVVIHQLTELGQFSEALEWGMSSEKIRSEGSLYQILYRWDRADPEGAKVWLDSANLPANEKAHLSTSLKEDHP